MKFLITEDKRERLVDKQLSDEYDGLIRFVGSNRPDLIFFITNTGKNMVEKDNIFYYNKDLQVAFIPWNMVDGIRMFTSNEFESEQFVKRWLNKTYGIDPVRLYKIF